MINKIRDILILFTYLIGLIILHLLYPEFNTSKKGDFQIILFLIFWLTTISLIVSVLFSINYFFKREVFKGQVYLFTFLSIYFIDEKLIFVDYNTFIHLAFIVLISIYLIIYRKQSKPLILYSVFLATNLIAFFLSDHSILSHYNSTKISWVKNGLNWEDYQDSFSNHKLENYYDSEHNEINPENIKAITTNSIKYKVNTNGSIPSIVIGSYFVPDESFVKPEYKSNEQLNHELGYLNICEYYTRLIRKSFRNKTTGMINYKTIFKKYNLFFSTNIQSNIQNAEIFIDGMIAKKEMMNEQYMLDTDFGKDLVKQKEWDSKIQNLLTLLEGYK